MTTHQMELLLSVIKQHMDMDLRAKIMREVPQAYNALVGNEIVKVIHTADGRPVRKVA